MPKYILTILSLVFMIPLTAQSGVSPAFKKVIDEYLTFSVPTMTVDQLHQSIDEYIILDARERDEYAVSHIPGALYVGYDDFNEDRLKKLDKTQKVVIYCSIGYRSEKIGEKLASQGFQVYNLYGSLFAWANAGYPLVDKDEKSTRKVHGYNKSWSKWIEKDGLEKVY